MSHALLATIAFFGGGLIAVQAGFNARLGTDLQNPLLASTAAFLTAFVCAGLLYVTLTSEAPATSTLAAVPRHLWVVGGVLAAVAVCTFVWLIPQLGITPVIVCALVGQLLTSLVAGHFGWFDMPQTPIDTTKLLGAFALLVGTLLVAR